MMPTATRSPTPFNARCPTPAHIEGLSLVNLAARQRMLSQRMILQTVLAARGDADRLKAAQRSLAMFTESHAHLMDTIGDAESDEVRQKLHDTYLGAQGVGPQVQAFMQLMRHALEQIGQASPRAEGTVAELVALTDRILEALNTATTAFDDVAKARTGAMGKELTSIVADIQSVAKEAKVVSFNAQVVAARAGQHGREFAVVANVLSDITSEIDQLTRKAAVLAERTRHAG